jgi:hypothetical protein
VSTSLAERLLERLDSVRRSGRGWIARCPAHDDRLPSLAITIGDDGRVLICDHGGCATPDVLAAVGMSVSDLFERRVMHATTPADRAELRERARQADWRAALGVVDFEAKIVLIAVSDLCAGRPIDDADRARLTLAVERITEARSRLVPASRFRPTVT